MALLYSSYIALSVTASVAISVAISVHDEILKSDSVSGLLINFFTKKKYKILS